MADQKKVEEQYIDRLKDLAERAAPMIAVLEALAEQQNELGKTKGERNEKWKDLLASAKGFKAVTGSIEELQLALATLGFGDRVEVELENHYDSVGFRFAPAASTDTAL